MSFIRYVLLYKFDVPKAIQMYRIKNKYSCSRKVCICNETLLYKFYMLEKNQSMMCFKPILKQQKECKAVFEHFRNRYRKMT